MAESRAHHVVRFGAFEFDLRSGDLRKAGARVHLAGQPLLILIRLVSRPGELVSRDALRRELWPDNTVVDFERNLNSAVKRLRAALGDSATAPRFIETLPKRGYRLLVPVHDVPRTSPASPEAPAVDPLTASPRDPLLPPARVGPAGLPRRLLLLAGLLVAMAAIGAAAYRKWPSSSTPIDALVVLPFVSATTGDRPVEDYLSFGMTDAITTEISKLAGIAVISQTSAAHYSKATRKPLPEIARELGVDAVVEGSVMRDGNRIRITVQLIEASSDTHLWANTYEREIGKVFPIFQDVARAVAREMHATIVPAESGRVRAEAATDQRIYESYLRGRYHLAKGTEAEFLKAKQYFEQVVASDPTHAPSHSGLADYYVLTDAVPPRVALPRARIHAGHALALDASLADAHVSLAFVHYYGDWAWDAAEREFRRALDLDPNHSRGRRWFGLFLAAMGRHDEAQAQMERALLVDPVSMVNHDATAAARFNARAYDDVLAHARKLLDLDPGDPRGFEHQSLALIQKGHHDSALAAVDRGLFISPNNTALRTVKAICLARLGRTVGAIELLDALEGQDDVDYVPPIFLGAVAAAVGQRERALGHLDRAYDTRDPYMVLLKESPLFDPLRGTARFRQIAGRMKFPD
jgi:TolB-like protein/DNA-binding winged helix-turn-helix (wHTH) protein/tetratricopeptide (TPR) repeat protein